MQPPWLKKSWSCGTIVAYKRAPRERESKERESVESAVEKPREKVKGCKGSSLAAIAAAASAARELGVRS